MKNLVFYLLLFLVLSSHAQEATVSTSQDYLSYKWSRLATGMPESWYATEDAKHIADSVLKYQTEIGGWAKNQNYHKGYNQKEWAKIIAEGIGATFDNGATITEMKFLAKMYNQNKDERYKQAFNKAINYILISQYENGGWPQFYPTRPSKSVSYNTHITYNDNAMINVMTLLKDVLDDKPFYQKMEIGKDVKDKIRNAFNKGIDCILKTQIIVDSQPTIWCAQHDEKSLKPAKARAYELASFSGAESVGIALLLMDIAHPSKEVIYAVNGAKSWFEQHKIEGVKIQYFTNAEGLKDVKVVADKNAPALWARFYDLETQQPFFCDRDGIKRNALAELGYNRRTGYSWYTSGPAKVIEKYEAWNKKWAANVEIYSQ